MAEAMVVRHAVLCAVLSVQVQGSSLFRLAANNFAIVARVVNDCAARLIKPREVFLNALLPRLPYSI